MIVWDKEQGVNVTAELGLVSSIQTTGQFEQILSTPIQSNFMANSNKIST